MHVELEGATRLTCQAWAPNAVVSRTPVHGCTSSGGSKRSGGRA